MSDRVNDSIDKSSIMDRGEKEERIVDIYITAEAVRDIKHKKQTEEPNTTTTQPTEHTGSECVKNRSPRSVLVCLVVLCVLLLTAVIVLCVLIYKNNHQFNINNKHITQERDRLLTNNTKLTEERDRLLTNNTKLTEEKDRLLTNNTKLIEEKDRLLTNNTKLIEERDELWTLLQDGWIYLISSEKKSWNESRSYCRKRGADLIIINYNEEQDFVKNMSRVENIWIGLSDSEKEGRWKWVDGSTMNYSSWKTNEPGGQRTENCAVSHSQGWADFPCHYTFKWICEKNLFKKGFNVTMSIL